jgi:hypothetical protein
MSKKPLPIEEKKIKVSITIDRKVNEKLEAMINNKSKYIEDLLIVALSIKS